MSEYTHRVNVDQRLGDGCKLANDAHCLLTYVARNKSEKQSLKGLARETDIPYANIKLLLLEYFELRGESLLANVARAYRIQFYVYPRSNWDKNYFNDSKIIDAVECGFNTDEYPMQGDSVFY